MKKNIAPILAGMIIAIVTGVFIAHATETSYTPLAQLPISGNSTPDKTYTLSTYLSGMIKLIIALAAVASILITIIGGVQYVASGIAPSAKQDAKNRITNALIGLTLILTSYLILNSINPNLVNVSFTLPAITTNTTAETTTLSVSSTGTGNIICVTAIAMPSLSATYSQSGYTCAVAAQGASCYTTVQTFYQCTK